MQQRVSSSVAISKATLVVGLLMLISVNVEAAPTKRDLGDISILQVRMIHYESGKYVTLDPNTGRVSATSSARNDNTLFTQYTGTGGSLRFVSAALENHFLSIVKEGNSTYYSVVQPSTENSGQSGQSSGSGSGEAGSSTENTVQIYTDWIAEKIINVHSTLKIKIDGQYCYLAFDWYTGQPVSDPCSITDSDSNTYFSI